MARAGRRRYLASLTSRLVVTVVLLVAVVSLLIGIATAFAMRDYLTGRVDAQVEAGMPGGSREPDDDRDHDGDGGPPRYSGVGTLVAQLDDTPSGSVIVQDDDEAPEPHALSPAALDVLAEVPTDGEVHPVDVPGVGHYRVAAVSGAFLDPTTGARTPVTLVNGLPTGDVDDTIRNLVGLELLLGLLGVAAAAGVGLVVVRRQLRPLREVAMTAERVAELPLSSGEIELTERVPEHLTDEDTEVGQVGASLNTLLAHVESSLEVRHRSEQQVRQFVADASHELRTPLTTIKGYAELARRRPDDTSAVLTALDKVEAESGRMTSLVEDLLLLARLDSGRPLERQPVDLTRLLLEAVSDARVLAPDHRWRLDLPDTALHVVGDEQRLHQLVTNLLTNAREAHPGRHHRHRDRPGGRPHGARRRPGLPGRPGADGVRALRPRRRRPHAQRRRRCRTRPGPGGGHRDRPRRLRVPDVGARRHHRHRPPAAGHPRR